MLQTNGFKCTRESMRFLVIIRCNCVVHFSFVSTNLYTLANRTSTTPCFPHIPHEIPPVLIFSTLPWRKRNAEKKTGLREALLSWS